MKYILHYKYYLCRVLAKAGLLKYFSFFFTIRINNKKINIPVINGNGYFNLFPVKEAWMETLIQKCLAERQGCIIDVGVNLGQTLLKIASFNNKVDYYGFEPNPVCYNYSKELIKRNDLPSFKILPVGLSDDAAVVKLFGDNDHASGATVVEGFRNNTKKYKVIHHVPVLRGDIVLNDENINAINFIKIDVEGAELEVVKGLQQTLQKYRPVLILEILPVYSLESPNGKMRKERQDQLLQLLREMQYDLFLIKEQEVKLKKLDDIPVHGDMGSTNYLLVPSTSSNQFSDMLS
ncbi:FkbM family methyltransferase [Panacibacter ginsenosidivorans]|uniref:FkbM family methyltransferase n=1 Tax=Panacibacter ginsenosidivorans TaxID=1813871 RepID=A0A5B8V565_9BACT|nr:FkbM family methyltransferase [Panacibacter ginsenosidivorans]QEC66524.1 FkbM family methyltransferase [Panacibacter ginsenosidivorans]